MNANDSTHTRSLARSLARSLHACDRARSHSHIRTCTHLDQWPADHPARKTSRKTIAKLAGARSIAGSRYPPDVLPANRSSLGARFAPRFWYRCFPSSAVFLATLREILCFRHELLARIYLFAADFLDSESESGDLRIAQGRSRSRFNRSAFSRSNRETLIWLKLSLLERSRSRGSSKNRRHRPLSINRACEKARQEQSFILPWRSLRGGSAGAKVIVKCG